MAKQKSIKANQVNVFDLQRENGQLPFRIVSYVPNLSSKELTKYIERLVDREVSDELYSLEVGMYD